MGFPLLAASSPSPVDACRCVSARFSLFFFSFALCRPFCKILSNDPPALRDRLRRVPPWGLAPARATGAARCRWEPRNAGPTRSAIRQSGKRGAALVLPSSAPHPRTAGGGIKGAGAQPPNGRRRLRGAPAALCRCPLGREGSFGSRQSKSLRLAQGGETRLPSSSFAACLPVRAPLLA